MSEYEAQEIKARIALSELEEKTKLVKVIKRKQNWLMGFWFTLSMMCLVIPYYLESDSADASFVGFIFSTVPLLLLYLIILNVNHRLDTLVKLLEVDKCLLKNKNESDKQTT